MDTVEHNFTHYSLQIMIVKSHFRNSVQDTTVALVHGQTALYYSISTYFFNSTMGSPVM
jgi:hypothetical protein